MNFPLSLIDSVALAGFVGAWFGYTHFAKYRAKRGATFSSLTRLARERWMREMMRRENRIGDANIVGNVKSVVTFFASTTVLLLAGVLTAISASEGLAKLLSDMHIGGNPTVQLLQLKLFVLALVMVYAFFKFTWSIRQHIICGILIGAAPWDPSLAEHQNLPDDMETLAMQAAKLSDLASHDFNHGLRAYYFSLALLAWLVNVWLFIGGTLWVILVLYQREFNSRTVEVLKRGVIGPSS